MLKMVKFVVLIAVVVTLALISDHFTRNDRSLTLSLPTVTHPAEPTVIGPDNRVPVMLVRRGSDRMWFIVDYEIQEPVNLKVNQEYLLADRLGSSSATNEDPVLIRATIDEQGNVINPEILGNAHNPHNDDVIAKVRKWKYEPPLAEGKAVRLTVLMIIRFRSPPVQINSSLNSINGFDTEITEPKKLKDVPPHINYSPGMREGSPIEGTVLIEITIDKEGKVTNPKVIRSVPLLDKAVIDAVSQWEYQPTLLNGVAVPVIMTVTVNFKK